MKIKQNAKEILIPSGSELHDDSLELFRCSTDVPKDGSWVSWEFSTLINKKCKEEKRFFVEYDKIKSKLKNNILRTTTNKSEHIEQ